jgi:hypothetical protein
MENTNESLPSPLPVGQESEDVVNPQQEEEKQADVVTDVASVLNETFLLELQRDITAAIIKQSSEGVGEDRFWGPLFLYEEIKADAIDKESKSRMTRYGLGFDYEDLEASLTTEREQVVNTIVCTWVSSIEKQIIESILKQDFSWLVYDPIDSPEKLQAILSERYSGMKEIVHGNTLPFALPKTYDIMKSSYAEEIPPNMILLLLHDTALGTIYYSNPVLTVKKKVVVNTGEKDDEDGEKEDPYLVYTMFTGVEPMFMIVPIQLTGPALPASTFEEEEKETEEEEVPLVPKTEDETVITLETLTLQKEN